MRLPYPERAIVDIEKLRGYCLSAEHPRGRHKARVFAARLGLTAGDAELLRNALLGATRTCDAVPGELDGFGQRYVVEFTMDGPERGALIRSTWIVRRGERFARFVTCYVV
jgi:hypothetical protein